MTVDEIDDFLSNIDRRGKPGSCWPWTGKVYKQQGGYGSWHGEGAHRVAYRLKHGEIPEGAVVRHSCDNPPCCNPSHLEVGTHADNRQDCVTKGRHAKGGKHGHATLTGYQVGRIRAYHKGWTHARIAEKYGVSRSVITNVLNRQTYLK